MKQKTHMLGKILGIARVAGMSAVLLVFGGCVATPQPYPPNVYVEVNGNKLFNEAINFGSLIIKGRPGAIEPPEAILRVYNLENTLPSVDLQPESDGSFSLEIEGDYGDEFRLQAMVPDRRSKSIDVVVNSGTIGPAPRPLSDCFYTVPGLELNVTAAVDAPLLVHNDCAEMVTLESAGLRDPESGFTAEGLPTQIERGTSTTITIHVDAEVEFAEDILMLEVSTPERDRRPVTLVSLEQ